MLHKSKSPPELNITKCTTTTDEPLTFWPPSTAAIDTLVLKFKAKHGDMDANWAKTILNFKKELDAEQQFKPTSSSGVNNNNNINGAERGRAKFSVPLSRREMEKDFEDMGERRLPRKPKKRPKTIQNQLDTLFPGLWLTEIHADLYRVSETKKFIGSISTSCPSSDSFSMGGIYGRTGQTQVNFLAINRDRVAAVVEILTLLALVCGFFVILKLT